MRTGDTCTTARSPLAASTSRLDGRYPRLKIADWQVAARPHGTGTTNTTHTQDPGRERQQRTGASLIKHVERSAGPYLAPEFATPDAPPALLDVFGLGALSYLILTGNAPADTREQLAQQLTAEHALVPSSVTDSISPSMDALVREATAIYPGERTESVRRFLKDLDRDRRRDHRPGRRHPGARPAHRGQGRRDQRAGPSSACSARAPRPARSWSQRTAVSASSRSR